MSRREPQPAFGFTTGFRAVFRGARFIAATPTVWAYAAVPSAILCALTLVSVWVSFAWLGPWLSAHLPPSQAWYGELGKDIVRYVSALLATVLGTLLALALTPPLSAPALERIVRAQERELGAPPRAELGFWAELGCGLRAQAAAALIVLPIVCALWLIDLLFPPAAVATTPLKLALAALGLAWNLFDYPLTLRGVGLAARIRLAREHKGLILGFGLAFSLLFIVPCCAVVLLPVGVAGATHTLWQLAARDPRLLAELVEDARAAQLNSRQS